MRPLIPMSTALAADFTSKCMDVSNLKGRMQALKDIHDTQVRSEDKTPTPLWVLLYIYNKATHECYINYMDGAEHLIKYLSPIELPVMPLTTLPIPRVLVNYELSELARHILVSIEGSYNNLNAWRRVELAIVQESLKLAQREIL